MQTCYSLRSRGGVRAISSSVREAIVAYLLDGTQSDATIEWRNSGTMFANPWFRPLRFYVGDEDGNIIRGPVRNDAAAYIYIEGDVLERDVALNVGYALYDSSGTLLYWSATTDSREELWPKFGIGRNNFRSRFPSRTMNEGVYRAELMISLYHRQWISRPGSNAPAIDLSIQGGLSDSPYWVERRPGILAPVCPWTLNDGRTFASDRSVAQISTG